MTKTTASAMHVVPTTEAASVAALNPNPVQSARRVLLEGHRGVAACRPHLSIAVLATLLGCTNPEPTPPVASTETCVVQQIGDGDSLTCEGGRRVRLLLIDAPELAQREPGQQAQRAFVGLAPRGTRLRLELDVQPTDTHGRTLAYAYLPDGRMVNEELARLGMVVTLTYPPNVRHVERIQAAVESARRSRHGLWAKDAFRCLPRDFRGGRCGEGGGRRR